LLPGGNRLDHLGRGSFADQHGTVGALADAGCGRNRFDRCAGVRPGDHHGTGLSRGDGQRGQVLRYVVQGGVFLFRAGARVFQYLNRRGESASVRGGAGDGVRNGRGCGGGRGDFFLPRLRGFRLQFLIFIL
jgi:hypothetical protein